jgi:hypothetical protein
VILCPSMGINHLIDLLTFYDYHGTPGKMNGNALVVSYGMLIEFRYESVNLMFHLVSAERFAGLFEEQRQSFLIKSLHESLS